MANTIYLVSGRKGGVGKSIVSMALVDYLQMLGVDVLLIETDNSNPMSGGPIDTVWRRTCLSWMRTTVGWGW